MSQVKVCIITGDGVNCERETKRAFEAAGALCTITHINDKVNLDHFDILAFPGGFSFGDELGSGKVFALKIEKFYGDEIHQFVKKGKPIIGICNGFQVLAKLGLFSRVGDDQIKVGLAKNDSGQFIDQWSKLSVNGEHCIWLKGIKEIFLPIRHGEGRVVFGAGDVKAQTADFDKIKARGRDVLRYHQNPNGAHDDLAGLCDDSGLVFGLMPHPEAAIKSELYPGGHVLGSLGLTLFQNAVNYVLENQGNSHDEN